MLMKDALTEFILDCRLRKLSERTIKGYHNNCAKMLQFCQLQHGIDTLESITPLHIKSYISYLVSLRRKESYINSILKCLRAFFYYCVNENYLPVSPADKIRFQKEPLTKISTFTDNEVRTMLTIYDNKTFLECRNKTILTVLFDSGIRCQELCDIELQDISEGYILIHGKGKKERLVPMTPAIQKQLIRYYRLRENYLFDKYQLDSNFLFLSFSCHKLTIGAIEKMIADCAELAKVRDSIRASPHTCRHYYAQAQLKNGCDVYTLSRLLGHTNITITKRYLQSMSDDDILEMGKKSSPLSNIL